MKKISLFLSAMLLGVMILSTADSGSGDKGFVRKPGETPQVTKETDRERSALPESLDNQVTEKIIQDDEFYRNNIQNRKQGNGIAFDGEYYYFRSQAGTYSLCRSRGPKSPVEVAADETPGEICVLGERIYFVNISDNQCLYSLEADGGEPEKITSFPVQGLIVSEDRIYFQSVYDREADPFYQLTEPKAENDRYVYSMNLEGGDIRPVIPEVCDEVTSDGSFFYYKIYDQEDGSFTTFQCKMDGRGKKKLMEEQARGLLAYGGDLYWISIETRELIRLRNGGGREVLAQNVDEFAIADEMVYLFQENQIRLLDLGTGKEQYFAEKSGEREVDSWYLGLCNRGIFLTGDLVFSRYFESEEKGVLWHVLDRENRTFQVFEDMEPRKKEELVSDTPISSELLFYLPGRKDEEAAEYLGRDLTEQDAYGVDENGQKFGKFSLRLPQFLPGFTGSRQINRAMVRLREIAMEDRDRFFTDIYEIRKKEPEYWGGQWYLNHSYDKLYVGDRYLSLHFSRKGCSGGIRPWEQSFPMTFDKETGSLVSMDQLFLVDRRHFMKRLTSAVYKFSEMDRSDDFFGKYDTNILVKEFIPNCFYLTPDGLVMCYEKYSILPGAWGNPKYEIPYSWFEDIFYYPV